MGDQYGCCAECEKAIAGIIAERDGSEAELARLREEVERYRTTFAHIHEKQGERDDDSCGKCGLDLRDSVHSKRYRVRR